jgi:hypothetical protein
MPKKKSIATAEGEAQKPSRAFLTKLYAKLKEAAGDISEDDFNAAVTYARAHAGGTAKAEKAKMRAGEESLTDIIEKVNTALTNAFRTTYDRQSIFYWAKEVYADRCIACSSVDNKVYEIPYTINADGEVEFGDPVEVEETYVPVGMNELSRIAAKGHSARLFMECVFADPPEWMPLLPKPDTFKHPKYGEIVITKDRNEHFVQNFKDKVYQEKLPVDAEHETKLSGAVGWITDMRVNADGSADAKVEWTDRGVSLIEADRFAYVSPEWYDAWTDPATEVDHEDIVIGAALTTRPFFKESSLRPLVANESGLHDLDETKSTPTNLYFTALAPVANKESKSMAEEKKTATAEPPKDEAQRFAESESARQAAEARADKAEGEVKQMGERIDTLEKEGRTRRFSDLIKSGNWLGSAEKHLKFMEKFGEDTEEFKDYVTEQSAIAEQAKDGKLFAEIGSDQSGASGDAYGQLQAKATELRKADTALTQQQAFKRACNENPKLYEQSQAEERRAN